MTEQIKGHERYIRLNQPERSGLAEHSLVHQHIPLFESMAVLSGTENLWSRGIMDAIFIYNELPCAEHCTVLLHTPDPASYMHLNTQLLDRAALL